MQTCVVADDHVLQDLRGWGDDERDVSAAFRDRDW